MTPTRLFWGNFRVIYSKYPYQYPLSANNYNIVLNKGHVCGPDTVLFHGTVLVVGSYEIIHNGAID